GAYRKRAGANRLAVDVDGTGTTCRYPASELGPGKAEVLAQHPQQRRLFVDVDTVRGAIDVELYHVRLPIGRSEGHGARAASSECACPSPRRWRWRAMAGR